jgi:hypothetical protein
MRQPLITWSRVTVGRYENGQNWKEGTF